MPVESQIIKPIAKGIVHRICAGQVIFDLSSAIKELVENSLDAGATSIEISLKDFGEEWFQVIDNGCGISPNNFKVYSLLKLQNPKKLVLGLHLLMFIWGSEFRFLDSSIILQNYRSFMIFSL